MAFGTLFVVLKFRYGIFFLFLLCRYSGIIWWFLELWFLFMLFFSF